MSGEGSEEKKQPFYQSESFKSGFVGTVLGIGSFKAIECGIKEIYKKIKELSRKKLEYEQREREKNMEMYKTELRNEMRKFLDEYLQDKDKLRPQAD